MARIGMCEIRNLRLSDRSRRSVRDIKDVLERGTMLGSMLAATPFYYIFGTPGLSKSPFETLMNIREADWDTFVKAMGGATLFVRDQVFRIAYEAEFYTSGEEQKFWHCVSEASK